jgi:hypothetical protein
LQHGDDGEYQSRKARIIFGGHETSSNRTWTPEREFGPRLMSGSRRLAMILPYDANPRRMEFSERTGANQYRAACSGKEPAANGATKLSDLGITKKQSASWQKPRRATESTLSVEIEMV